MERWRCMDIEYLLFLQRHREATGGVLVPFMEHISLFAVTYLIMIPVFIYWAVSKKRGLYVLTSYYLCCGFNAFVKLTACIYRPWIRDARVMPAGDAITTATGYSFPSGHTVTAGPIYGGIAVISAGWKKWVAAICIVFALLTPFSRNYLGVHTPQDVCFGLLESIIWLFVVSKIFRYLTEHPEKENLFLLICFILGWIGIIYITFKPYPMTYVDGVLLVDPQKMLNDGYGDGCLLIAFPVARFIERKWIGFKATGLRGRGLVISLVGMIPLFLMIKYMKPPLDGMLGSHWGHFVYTFIVVMYCVAIFPAVIKCFSGNENREKK